MKEKDELIKELYMQYKLIDTTIIDKNSIEYQLASAFNDGIRRAIEIVKQGEEVSE